MRGTTSLLVGRNIRRRPVRSIILALCVASVVGMQVAAVIIDRAGKRGLELGLQRLGADLVAVPRGLSDKLESSLMTGEAALFYMDRSVEEAIAGFEFVDRTSPQLYIKSLSGASCCSAWNIFLIGFDPETDFTVRPWLSENLDRPIHADEVLVGAAFFAEDGDTLRFYGREFKVAGKLDPTGGGLDVTVFIPIESAYLMAEESAVKAEQPLELSRRTISAVLIGLKPEAEGGRPRYRAAFELEQGIEEIAVIQPSDLVEKVESNLNAALGSLRYASLAVWPMTALLIALVFAMAVNERRQEIGLMRAMGATRAFVFRLMMLEAVSVAGLGAAAGIAGSTGVLCGFSRLISRSLEVPFYWPGPGELFVVLAGSAAAALLTGAAAAFVPSVQSCNMEPYEAIRRIE